jgi:prepilin peptidase CpaA
MKFDPAFYILAFFLIFASIKDCLSYRIPNWITLPALLTGIAYFSLARGYDGFLFSLSGALTGFALLFIPYVIGGSGAGDVKLMAAVGSFLGPKGVFVVFLVSCVFGGVYALLLMASRGMLLDALRRYGRILKTFLTTRHLIYIPPSQREKQLKICYGLAIALGTASYWVWGAL